METASRRLSTPTKLKLQKLLDISMGTPERGVVNFNALHTLLSAIIRKLQLDDYEVDCEPIDELTMLLNLKRRMYVI